MSVMRYVLLVGALGCGASSEKTPSADDSANAEANVAISTGAEPAKYPPGTIIMFAGTSLTAGYGLDPDSAYPQHLQRLIDSAGMKFQIVNAGVSGETSSGLLRRLNWLLREPFEIIVIETGANDGLRGIPVETMERNLQQIIDGVRAGRRHAQIVLVQMEAPPNLGSAYTRQFRDVFPQIARKNGIALLPFLLDGVAGQRHLNQGDGIHPNDDGSRQVAQNVFRALRPLLQ